MRMSRWMGLGRTSSESHRSLRGGIGIAERLQSALEGQL